MSNSIQFGAVRYTLRRVDKFEHVDEHMAHLARHYQTTRDSSTACTEYEDWTKVEVQLRIDGDEYEEFERSSTCATPSQLTVLMINDFGGTAVVSIAREDTKTYAKIIDVRTMIVEVHGL